MRRVKSARANLVGRTDPLSDPRIQSAALRRTVYISDKY
jgi:hypothetical protein